MKAKSNEIRKKKELPPHLLAAMIAFLSIPQTFQESKCQKTLKKIHETNIENHKINFVVIYFSCYYYFF